MMAHLRSEQGFTLVEALVSVAILALALTVFLTGLSTGVLSASHSDRLSAAHELARSQMEYTKELPYQPAPTSYATVTPVASYSITASAAAIPEGDDDVQLIKVEVSKDGTVVFTLEGYKVNR
jgi:prepilin-type N-terminal cleavage/methylation domain-containing protein